MGRTLDKDKRDAIRLRMTGLKGKEARIVADQCASEFGVTRNYVYEITTDVRPRRKKRSDAAGRKVILTPEQRLHLFAQVLRNETSAKVAIETAVDPENKDLSLYIEPEKAPTAQWVNSELRAYNLSLRARKQKSSLTPYTRREAAAANDVWFLDGTVGEQFYIEEDFEHIFYHDPTDRKQPKLPQARIIAVADGHSRVQFMDIFTDESAVSVLDLLYKAISRKDYPEEFPFEGIPKNIYSDPGPGIMAKKTRDAAAVLGISITPHPPREPWKKGMIERAFRTLIDRQKARKLAPRWTFKEFRSFLYRYCLWYNNRKHSTTGMAPFDRWLASMNSGAGQIRQAPDETLKKYLLHDRFERVLEASGIIRLHNRQFKITRELQHRMAYLVGQKVEVLADPQNKDAAYVVFQGEAHRIQADGIIPAWEQFDGAGAPVKESEREKLLKLVKSKEAGEILGQVKGVGLPLSGPERKLTAEPISFQEQLQQRGKPAREAVDRYAAVGMLVEAGLVGEFAINDELARTLLDKLVAHKEIAGESIFRDEVVELIRQIEELEIEGEARSTATA